MFKNLLLFFVVFQVPSLFGQQVPYSQCEINGEDVFIKFNETCLNSDDEACMALAEFKHYDLAAVIKSGAQGIAMMRGISEAADIEIAARQYTLAVQGARMKVAS